MNLIVNTSEKPEVIEELKYYVNRLRNPETFKLYWDVYNGLYLFGFDGTKPFSSPTLETVINHVKHMVNNESSEKLLEDPKPDMVNHPSHYTFGKVECIDALESMAEGYNVFGSSKEGPCVFATLAWQVVKYIWRAPLKGKMREDLMKAKFYLERLIAKVEETENAG